MSRKVSDRMLMGADWDGVRREPMTPGNMGGAEVAVLTLDSYSEFETDRRSRSALVFREVPHLVFYTGKQGVAALVRGMNTEVVEQMLGRRVPLVLTDVENPATGGTVRKYVVADPDEWDALLRAAPAPTKAKAKAKGKATKRGRAK